MRPHMPATYANGITPAAAHSTMSTKIGTIRGPRDYLCIARFSHRQKRSSAMDWNRIEGNWKQMKGEVKKQWGALTDNDITEINGNLDKLEGKLQERYGKQRDEVRKEIDTWTARLH
jgi:uncharacterized protein YjbJ (UPF0337 family)